MPGLQQAVHPAVMEPAALLQASSPIDPDNVDRAFKRHLELAGLPNEIRFHDCRHTFASLLIAANAHPKYIQAQMGHTSITTTMDRYGHLMGSGFERVGERLDQVVFGTVQGTRKAPAGNVEAGTAR